MWPGTRPRAPQPAIVAEHRSPPIRYSGGCTFAEHPDRDVFAARIIWHADFDPDLIEAIAQPAGRGDADTFDPAQCDALLDRVVDAAGEHIVFSDGHRHQRLDLLGGSLAAGPVILHYRLSGMASARSKLSPLRRLLDVMTRGAFGRVGDVSDYRVQRWIDALRVADALAAGASQREIATVLYGERRVGVEWQGATDSMRSRVRRLVAEARRLTRGGYRELHRRHAGSSDRGPETTARE